MRIERDQLILLGMMAVVAAVFTVAVYLPIRSQQSQSQEQIRAYKTQLGIDLAGSKELPTLEKEVAALREACSGAQRDVPTQSELGDLIKALSGELERQQVRDRETQMRPVMQGADYSVLPVSLQFTASFRSLYSFLNQVESMTRLIRIDRLELTGTPEGGMLNARIELSTFFTEGEATGS